MPLAIVLIEGESKIMTSEVLAILENTFWACGTLAAVVAAWFKLRSTWLSKPEDREALQELYRMRWQRLRDGRYLEVPERGVGWLLGLKHEAAKQIIHAFSSVVGVLPSAVITSVAYVMFVPVFVGIWLRFGMIYSILAGVFGLFVLLALIDVEHPALPRSMASKIRRARFEKRLFAIVAMLLCASFIIWLRFALALDELWWTATVLSVAFPLYVYLGCSMLIAANASISFPEQRHDAAVTVGFAVAASVVVTAIALLIGSLAEPAAPIPRNVQLFLVNVLCDGVTLALTFFILGGAVDAVIEASDHRVIRAKYPIPVAIALDTIVAGVLACLSLYLGLLGSEHALTLRETTRVLVARAPSGGTYEFGPYFWAMHTTFIPTLMYLTTIALAWIGKLIILPVFHVMKKGNELEKPHDLTAAVFAFVAVLFMALAGLLSRMASDQVIRL